MAMEKRVRKLEKQIILLKAKIKANDLWKLELQTWIYQKFNRLIVDQVTCSASSSAASDESEPEGVDQKVDVDATATKPSKKRRRGGKAAAATGAIENDGTTGTSKRATKAGKRGSKKQNNNGVNNATTEETEMEQVTEQDMTLQLLENVHQDLIVVHTDGPQAKIEQDGTVTVTTADIENSGLSGSFVINPLIQGGISGVVVNHENVENHQSFTVESGDDKKNNSKKSNGEISYYTQSTATWTEPDCEVRADLQKYFRFVPSPVIDGKLRLLCLVEGCGTVLKVRPRCKWFNPVRHLAGVHKISEYVEQTPSSAMLGHQSKQSKKYLDL